jgi:DNA polymerase (family 10)
MSPRTSKSHERSRAPSNAEIASRLDDVAALLEEQDANQYRVQAWRNGAAAIRLQSHRVADVLRDEGLDGLDRIPGIGRALARAVRELIETGRLSTLDRLSGLRDTLADHSAAERGAEPLPPVHELLDVDREYRERDAAETLPRITPRRFNPRREKWLPVLHTRRGLRHYTALFSNTASAHRLGHTHDWVVIYLDGHAADHQFTVVTQPRGPMAGLRVVRGRERECAAHYAQQGAEASHV